MNEKLQNLIEALREELKQYGEMLALLECQQEMAVRRKSAELLQTLPTVDEQSEAIRLARFERDQRFRDLARTFGLAEECGFAVLVQKLPADYRPLVAALVDENNQLLKRVQRQAQQNHLLLGRALELMQRFMNTLIPGSNVSTYGETGRMHVPDTTTTAVYEALG